ncbi:MAG: segregation/condensation protein A [Planctomycetes bacterium]|nr:segregation/condensation protein A [Planctomycetota bacterium]
MIEPVHPEELPPSRPVVGAKADIAKSGDEVEPKSFKPGDPEGPDDDGEDNFTVHLDRVFRGPLDLLLQLVREKELEIHVVSLAKVCDAYCQYIRQLPTVEIDEAADYLVIAATLLAIKSKSLLPTEEVAMDEDPFDPSEELVAQLLAYKELRQASDQLAERWYARQELLPAGGKWLGKLQVVEDEEEEEWDVGDLSIWDLLKIINRLEAETGFMKPHQVRPVGRPLRAYVQEVWEKLQMISTTSLLTLLKDGNHGRSDAAFYFVALLELAKQQQIDLRQRDFYDDIHVQRLESTGYFNLDSIDDQFDDDPERSEPEVDELLQSELPLS